MDNMGYDEYRKKVIDAENASITVDIKLSICKDKLISCMIKNNLNANQLKDIAYELYNHIERYAHTNKEILKFILDITEDLYYSLIKNPLYLSTLYHTLNPSENWEKDILNKLAYHIVYKYIVEITYKLYSFKEWKHYHDTYYMYDNVFYTTIINKPALTYYRTLLE